MEKGYCLVAFWQPNRGGGQPRNTPGMDPFTPSVAEEIPELPPPTAYEPPIPPDDSGAVTAVLGDEVGLYGGTMDITQCDLEQMIAFLTLDEAKGQTWAGVHSITGDAVPAFIRSLTPVLLNQDTRVTNHGFRDGQATARQAVLERGTAVLVDPRAVPRAKCACGNPLLEPTEVETPTYVGETWNTFEPTQVAVIRPGAPAEDPTCGGFAELIVTANR